jgi:hypothetical protein
MGSMAPALVRPTSEAVSPAPYLGLRYRIMRADKTGEFTEIASQAELQPGEGVRLVIEANDSGYLYALEREAGGGWRLLASDRLERQSPYVIPPTGSITYKNAGDKELYLVLARRPVPAVATLDPRLLEEQLRRNLAVQEASATAADKSTYIVSTSGPLSVQQVAYRVVLKYR